MLTGLNLFIAQIIAHSAFVYFILNGSLWQWAVCGVVYFFNGCIGMTATYHRLISHKSWSCPPFIEYFGALCATLGLTGSAIAWVAVHRKHHRFTDLENDPHSPSLKGFFYCHWLSMFETVEIKYVSDLIKRPFYVFQHRYYFLINALYAGILFLIDPYAVVYAWLAPACILWNAGSSIVTFSHIFGANPHNLSNKARNNALLGILVFGEGWHNNHHAHPQQKRFAQHKGQLDLGYAYIVFVESLVEVYMATVRYFFPLKNPIK